MKKIYLATPIATKGEFNYSKQLAKRIRELGYEVYAAAENDAINDKTNDPTPLDIYYGDIYELLSSNIVIVNLTGSLEDGTITEVGIVAGWNEAKADIDKIKIIGYTSNARLLHPQFYKRIPSAGANHLTLGAIDKWGEFVGDEEALIKRLKEE